MGRTTTITLREHVDDEVMLRIARSTARSALYRPPGFLDDAEGHADGDEDEDLFGDHTYRSGTRGVYAHAEEECRSRRVDLRGPTDHDPGPIDMDDGADSSAQAVVLRFTPSSAR